MSSTSVGDPVSNRSRVLQVPVNISFRVASFLRTLCYWDSARTGWPSVSILVAIASLTYNFQLSVAACEIGLANRFVADTLNHQWNKQTGTEGQTVSCRNETDTADLMLSSLVSHPLQAHVAIVVTVSNDGKYR